MAHATAKMATPTIYIEKKVGNSMHLNLLAHGTGSVRDFISKFSKDESIQSMLVRNFNGKNETLVYILRTPDGQPCEITKIISATETTDFFKPIDDRVNMDEVLTEETIARLLKKSGTWLKKDDDNVASLNYSDLKKQIEKRCSFCKKNGETRTCNRCKKARYCNRECQKAHWAIHKLVCCK